MTVRGQGLFHDGVGVRVRAQEIDDGELSQLGRSLVAQAKIVHSGRCIIGTSDSGLGGHELIEAGSAQETSMQLHLDLGVVVLGRSTGWGGGARDEKARSIHLPMEVLELRVETERSAVLLLLPLLQREVGRGAVTESLDSELMSTLTRARQGTTDVEHEFVLLGWMRCEGIDAVGVVDDLALPA